MHVDIDEEDRSDPKFHPEYAREIFERCREQEVQKRTDPGYLNRHPALWPEERGRIVAEISRTHRAQCFRNEALFTAVAVLDRYLSRCRPGISVRDAHIAGHTALLLACKVEEIFVTTIGDVLPCSVTCHYTKDELRSVSNSSPASFRSHPTPPRWNETCWRPWNGISICPRPCSF